MRYHCQIEHMIELHSLIWSWSARDRDLKVGARVRKLGRYGARARAIDGLGDRVVDERVEEGKAEVGEKSWMEGRATYRTIVS